MNAKKAKKLRKEAKVRQEREALGSVRYLQHQVTGQVVTGGARGNYRRLKVAA